MPTLTDHDGVHVRHLGTSAAADLLRPLQGNDPGILGAIKHTMFGRVAQALTNDQKALN